MVCSGDETIQLQESEENPLPRWMRKPEKKKKEEPKELDLVEQFKTNPDSFFLIS